MNHSGKNLRVGQSGTILFVYTNGSWKTIIIHGKIHFSEKPASLLVGEMLLGEENIFITPEQKKLFRLNSRELINISYKGVHPEINTVSKEIFLKRNMNFKKVLRVNPYNYLKKDIQSTSCFRVSILMNLDEKDGIDIAIPNHCMRVRESIQIVESIPHWSVTDILVNMKFGDQIKIGDIKIKRDLILNNN